MLRISRWIHRPVFGFLAIVLPLLAIAGGGMEARAASWGGVLSQGALEESDPGYAAPESRPDPTFPIRKFDIVGSTLYPGEILDEVLREFLGTGRTADDVEQSRALLERFFQETGYVRVLVNIPEQEVEHGIVKLEVTESRIGNVVVTGNRYFTRETILTALPSLQPGKILYVPDVEKELNDLNKTPDLTVRLGLQPSRELGVDDVELKVEDRLPLHARLELSNRSTHDTSGLRFNGMLRFDNLWQAGHSISVQYQTAPEEPEEVQVLGTSYLMPVPWQKKHMLATYGLWTDSDTAFGDGFSVSGKGFIVGLRYLVPLPPLEKYYHTVSFGLDYKDFDETIGFAGEADSNSESPISYLPFAAEYNGTYLDDGGTTRLKAALNWSFRGLVGKQEEFANKRLYAQADYMYLRLGLGRSQKLPWGMLLDIETEGQIASGPLISSEQFSAGGMESVRGYKESDSLGDDGGRASVEWRMPDLGKATGAGTWLRLDPYLFYALAWLDVQQPQQGQTDEFFLSGAGAGLRGSLWTALEYQADMAWALSGTDRTDAGDTRYHFLVKYLF